MVSGINNLENLGLIIPNLASKYSNNTCEFLKKLRGKALGVLEALPTNIRENYHRCLENPELCHSLNMDGEKVMDSIGKIVELHRQGIPTIFKKIHGLQEIGKLTAEERLDFLREHNNVTKVNQIFEESKCSLENAKILWLQPCSSTFEESLHDAYQFLLIIHAKALGVLQELPVETLKNANELLSQNPNLHKSLSKDQKAVIEPIMTINSLYRTNIPTVLEKISSFQGIKSLDTEELQYFSRVPSNVTKINQIFEESKRHLEDAPILKSCAVFANAKELRIASANTKKLLHKDHKLLKELWIEAENMGKELSIEMLKEAYAFCSQDSKLDTDQETAIASLEGIEGLRRDILTTFKEIERLQGIGESADKGVKGLLQVRNDIEKIRQTLKESKRHLGNAEKVVQFFFRISKNRH